jgi:radical SAM protein with 4Fe4S-binding SPASM domain
MNDKRTDAASVEWTLGFRARAHRNRIPISATLELTARCNLRCLHCYLGNQEKLSSQRELERDTESVKASLNEWVEAGCLYLLITGGDPMMRSDFSEIYRHACELGLLVTVFCDGILVNDSIIELFREFPPRKVEISIYGATAETYETVTRVPGSHARAWQGIRRLQDSGVRVGLKTVLLTLNQHELEDMEEQARELGVPFRTDAAVFPCLTDHSKAPLDFRVSPERVVAHDLAVPERRNQWIDKIRQTDALPETDQLYTCGAGATGFYSDPFGNLSPCLLTTHYQSKPDGRSFQEVWDTDLGAIREKKKTVSGTCLTGKPRGACTHCPAMNYLETGDEERESEYTRETTLLRYQAVSSVEMKR